jgi:hypothetical protein
MNITKQERVWEDVVPRNVHRSPIAITAIGVASPAQADDQSFLDDLHSHNVGTGIMSPSTVVGLGHFMCDRLRDGMSPADVAQLPKGPFIDGMGIVGAAQRDLCPDTVH